jgi:hypothetical protein
MRILYPPNLPASSSSQQSNAAVVSGKSQNRIVVREDYRMHVTTAMDAQLNAVSCGRLVSKPYPIALPDA